MFARKSWRGVRKASQRLERSLSSSPREAPTTPRKLSPLSEMDEWSAEEVSLWLVTIGMGAYSQSFFANEITGAELVSISEADLVDLGVEKMGHRKKIIRSSHRVSFAESVEVSSSTMDTSSSILAQGELASSSSSSGGIWRIKVSHHDAMRRVKVPFGSRLVDVRSEIEFRFKVLEGKDYDLWYLDDDGDKVALAKESDWQDAQIVTGNVIRVFVTDDEPYITSTTSNSASSSPTTPRRRKGSGKGKRTKRDSSPTSSAIRKHFELFEGLLSPILVIDSNGKIEYTNKHVTKFTGYNNLVGKNVTILMPPEHARRHQSYIDKYLETGKGKVLAIDGANVVVVTKDGRSVPVHLNVSETLVKGKKLFIGVFGESKAKEQVHPGSLISIVRDILDTVTTPAIAITPRCDIQVFNQAAQDLFGYSPSEVLGQNVKMLMERSQARYHDDYVSNYLITGEKKILGSGRNVVVQKKNGELLRLFLTVTERKDSTNHIFTGVLQPCSNE